MKQYIIIIMLVIVAAAPSLQNSFMGDDYGLIVNNPKINVSLREMPLIFTQSFWKYTGVEEHQHMYYRPMVNFFFVLNFKIWGINPVGFHLTNLFLHLLAGIVVYKIGLLLFESEKDKEMISLMGASIFSVHPVHNEPLCRVASGDVIFGFFVILSVYFYLKERKFSSLCIFFLALLSKEAAVMLPFALVILAVHKRGLNKGLVEIIPYIVLAGMFLILRAEIVGTVIGDEIAQPMFTRILTMSVATLDYIKLLIIPYPLNPYYPAVWYTSIAEPNVIIAILSLVSVFLFAINLRKNNAMFFLFVFSFLMLVPVIWRVNTLPVGYFDRGAIFERFLYVPAMSFSLFISAYAIKFATDKRRWIVLISWILVIAVFISLTISSSSVWKNDYMHYKKILEKSPDAGFAHAALGIVYKEMGRLDDALGEWEKALEFNPYDSLTLTSVGYVYFLKGDYENAIRACKAAIRGSYKGSKNIEVYYNLAIALERTGKTDEARVYYEEFISRAPERYKDIVSELRRDKGL